MMKSITVYLTRRDDKVVLETKCEIAKSEDHVIVERKEMNSSFLFDSENLSPLRIAVPVSVATKGFHDLLNWFLSEEF